MSLIRKNRKRLSFAERHSSFFSLLGRLGRTLFRTCLVLGAGALLALAGWETYRWALAAEMFSVRAIAIRGMVHLQEAEIVKLSGLTVGQNMFRLDTRSIERTLSTHPWISAVSARRRFPSTVEIGLKEHVPAALAPLGDLYLVDEEGLPFKKLQADDNLDLPLLTGLSREQYLAAPGNGAKRLREGIAAGRRYLRSAASVERLSEVRLLDDRVILVVGAGKEIYLNESVTDEQLQKLIQVRSELEERGLSAEVIHLDNRLRPGWITVKLAPALSERRGER